MYFCQRTNLLLVSLWICFVVNQNYLSEAHELSRILSKLIKSNKNKPVILLIDNNGPNNHYEQEDKNDHDVRIVLDLKKEHPRHFEHEHRNSNEYGLTNNLQSHELYQNDNFKSFVPRKPKYGHKNKKYSPILQNLIALRNGVSCTQNAICHEDCSARRQNVVDCNIECDDKFECGEEQAEESDIDCRENEGSNDCGEGDSELGSTKGYTE